MEYNLTAALLAWTALTDRVGQRITWNVRPQGETVPAVLLTRVAGTRHYTMTERSGLTETLIQVDVWAASLAEALAVKTVLLGLFDSLTAAPFQRCFVEAERDSFEPGDGPDELHLHRASLDVRVWHHA